MRAIYKIYKNFFLQLSTIGCITNFPILSALSIVFTLSRLKFIKKGKKKKKEGIEEARGTCWVGYQQLGMKKKGGKMVPNCVKEITELYYEVDGKGYGYTFEYINDGKLNEAEYQGRKESLVRSCKVIQKSSKYM